MERGVSVMVREIWVAVLSMPARCGSIAWQEMRNRTTPLVVVGSAGSFQPGLIDQPTRPVGGPRVVRLERIVFRPTAGSVLPSWWRSGGTEVRPIWVMPFHWDDPAGLARLVRSGRVWVCLAGIGGVPQLGQSPDDQALLEGDD